MRLGEIAGNDVSVSEGKVKVLHAGKVLVIQSLKYPEVEESWFDPKSWGEQATSVNAGGRGGAWFINADCSKLVLRHYLRGGLMARFSRRTYGFGGFERARSVAEFRLLEKLRELNLPVPTPVAAFVRRVGLLRCHAAILVERIEGAVPLPEHPNIGDSELWRSVGVMIARFHGHGLEHVDLNADNLLVSGREVFLIDFDRCRLHAKQSQNARWKQKNLDRLQRSIDKRCSKLPAGLQKELWEALKEGYVGAK